ncbi:MAG: FKBP-type peptidyl-prolyl cis-trans isomerase [Emcibacteraceae bacterium]|nr:FKBP-type peptidyl-prolyl cis-trans isomerase [Emcibacteraceae bacterium]
MPLTFNKFGKIVAVPLVGLLIMSCSEQSTEPQAAQITDTMEQQVTTETSFLEENKNKEGITVTDSGLQYKVLLEGTGNSPKATDRVTVHYEGTLTDGTVFDSSYERGQPIDFGLNQVIRGWTEGVQLMKEGAKYKFFIPSELAYGSRGAGGLIGPDEDLIFTVELIRVN